METRIALIGLIVEDNNSAERINAILHEYGDYIVGRMGIPYQKRKVAVISVIVNAPSDVINSISGKFGMIPHVSSKTIYAKQSFADD